MDKLTILLCAIAVVLSLWGLCILWASLSTYPVPRNAYHWEITITGTGYFGSTFMWNKFEDYGSEDELDYLTRKYVQAKGREGKVNFPSYTWSAVEIRKEK